ncbi:MULTISPECIES: ABC transporter permease [Micromonospora]|uniref:Transport permease protein n=1 Tax=Micromonospora yangpuensis TaxID=683228 RepID=A0A1C6UFF9_9ACTN|nr:ABC transporter permease [Micromonospora yangpuensis]GGM05843.1 transport permease protein [Micromonospora yangpuensis]SCL52681.1 ABC-2 type transport system permease protein [Micromonospora yangpuensis]
MNFLRDTMLIFVRQTRLAMRDPAWLIIGLTQPALYLAFLGPLLERITINGGGGSPTGNSWQLFVPGLLIQLGLFGAGFVGLGIIADVRAGVIERMRVTPVSRYALLVGRVLRDVVVLLAQAVVLLTASFAFGLRASATGLAIVLGMVALLGVSLSAGSYTLGLLLRREEALAPMLNAVMVPLMLLSGVVLPMRLAPGWLDAISLVTPFRYVVDAMRSALYGQYGTVQLWSGVAVAGLLAVVCLSVGARVFARESA